MPTYLHYNICVCTTFKDDIKDATTKTDLFMDVYETFNYFTKQLPHTTNIMTETGVNVVTQCTFLTEFHLQNRTELVLCEYLLFLA